MANGGRIPPDGRPPQAKGVGKDAKRHDLEAPKTPGIQNSDLVSGDVQRLEAAQRVAPISKRTQQPAARRDRPATARRASPGTMDVPDPIEMAAKRGGAQPFAPGTGAQPVDPTPWVPFMQQLAAAPNTGAGLTAALVESFAALRRRPLGTTAVMLDLDDVDETLGRQ